MHYHSEATEFLNQLKSERPHLSQDQQEGRSLLWDKAIDRKLQADFAKARVAQKAYVYQPSEPAA